MEHKAESVERIVNEAKKVMDKREVEVIKRLLAKINTLDVLYLEEMISKLTN